MKCRTLLFLAVPTLATTLFPQPTHAAIELGKYFRLNLVDPAGTDGEVRQHFNSITDIIAVILPNVMIAAGIILLFILAFGGFTIISSAGSTEKTQQGRQAITGAIIGFIIIFAAYWIIQVVEIITGIKILNPGI